MTTAYFNALHTPLHKGVNLIEASAGTGKTYAIAMLATRFVVEQADVTLDKLLLVTFTNAATDELKDRVRSRLAQVKRLLDEPLSDEDDDLRAWLDSLPLDQDTIRKRLQTALLDIDQASIFTIHGFCKRALREHALESGQLFDAELTDDLALLKQACVDDFWRKHIYPRSLWQAAILTAVYQTPDALLASIDSVAPHLAIYPECVDIDSALDALQQHADSAKNALPYCAEQLQARFAEKTFKDTYCAAFVQHFDALRDWLNGKTTQLPCDEALSLLTRDGLRDGLNGNKFRSNKNQSGDARKDDYLAELAIDTAPFDALAQALADITVQLRRNVLETLNSELNKRLLQRNELSFDYLISRLAEALSDEHAEKLITALQQRYSVALIDEFQDTDDSQWRIFSTLFNHANQYLYLIGDPKQAIYKFRGADIYSYLDAKNTAPKNQQFTLAKNWRSHPHLVTAVNTLFEQRAELAFRLENLGFQGVQPAKSPADGEVQQRGTAVAPMLLWQLGESDSKTGYWTAGKAANLIQAAVVTEIVSLLTDAYSLHPSNRPLQPKDIAILVRTNAQARDYQNALRKVGVPSVLNSTESVFNSDEARDVYNVLAAIANPSDSTLLKQALTLDWFGLSGRDLYALVRNENALDAWLNRFANYQQLWQKNGLLAMMRQLLAQENITVHLAKSELAERQLTNIYHLLELLQQAALDEHLGIHKTLEWLQHAIARGNTGSLEQQQLRLESDENAVKIVTMHRSKGLEYAVVFCPYSWYCNDALRDDLIQCHEDGKMIIDLGSPDSERRKAQALHEQHAEDCRLFYVAVTRAKYRCYVAWADVRTNTKPNESALAYLLGFDEGLPFAEQQQRLQDFAEQQPQVFAYQSLAVTLEAEPRRYRASSSSANLHAKTRSRSLISDWQMSSYTALAALSHDTPELPEDKTREMLPNAALDTAEASTDWLPRGAHSGNLIHELLENNRFSDLANGADISAQRDKLCARYGVTLAQPELLTALLQAIVQTPLNEDDTQFCLMNLHDGQCSKEMPFYLAINAINTRKIDSILSDSPDYQSLTDKKLSGYLTGFIDLVCQYDGRYYVMDYKTNSLPAYDTENLTRAMREHNYGLQYWLYTVVLHRYLQHRLEHYNYEQHFGGVRYLFIRGMQPEQPASGVYCSRPDYAKVQALAALFAH